MINGDYITECGGIFCWRIDKNKMERCTDDHFNRIEFQSGLRMYEHGGQMFPYETELERPLFPYETELERPLFPYETELERPLVMFVCRRLFMAAELSCLPILNSYDNLQPLNGVVRNNWFYQKELS